MKRSFVPIALVATLFLVAAAQCPSGTTTNGPTPIQLSPQQISAAKTIGHLAIVEVVNQQCAKGKIDTDACEPIKTQGRAVFDLVIDKATGQGVNEDEKQAAVADLANYLSKRVNLPPDDVRATLSDLLSAIPRPAAAAPAPPPATTPNSGGAR